MFYSADFRRRKAAEHAKSSGNQVSRAWSVEFPGRRQNRRFPDQDLFAIDQTPTIQLYPALSIIDADYLDLGPDHVAGAHRGEKLQGLTHVDRAVTGQLLSDDGRNQAGGEHSVRDATFKDRILRIIVIHMHRIVVGRDLGEHANILVGHNLLQAAHHAHLDFFDGDGSAWHVVQHSTLRALTNE